MLVQSLKMVVYRFAARQYFPPKIYFFYVYALQAPEERASDTPKLEVTDRCEPPCGCRDQNPCLLQEQPFQAQTVGFKVPNQEKFPPSLPIGWYSKSCKLCPLVAWSPPQVPNPVCCKAVSQELLGLETVAQTAGSTFPAPFPGQATVREENGPAPPAYFFCDFFFFFLLCSVYFLVKMNCNLFLMSTTSFLDLIFNIVLDTILSVSCYYLSLLVFLWGIFF